MALLGVRKRREHPEPPDCDDEFCPRWGCRMYRLGYQTGYAAGQAVGYAEGHAEGYSEGHSDGSAAGAGSGGR